MHFGDKIRQLRKQKEWTQPQLAEAIGIEQSYLSKLETGKSIPSADIFQLIMAVFDCNIASILEAVDETVIHRQLRQIPEVSNFLLLNKTTNDKKRKHWLILSALSVSTAIVLLVASYFGLLLPNVQYNYFSKGVVLEGESKEIFQNVYTAGGILKDEKRKTLIGQIDARLNEHYILSSSYRGNVFNVPVEGGSRTYNIDGKHKSTRMGNRYLAAIGLFFLLLGSFGFILEKRMLGSQ